MGLDFRKYEKYGSEDFASDAYFSEWIQSPNNSIYSIFWESFLKKHPEKVHDIEMARHKILNPTLHISQLSHQEIDDLWEKITKTINTT